MLAHGQLAPMADLQEQVANAEHAAVRPLAYRWTASGFGQM